MLITLTNYKFSLFLLTHHFKLIVYFFSPALVLGAIIINIYHICH